MKTPWIAVPAFLAVTWALAAAGQGPVSGAPTRVAFVSSQRILNESPDARAEVSRFRTSQQQTAKELRAKQEALRATRQKIAQATNDTQRAALRNQEQQQQADLERSASQAKNELQALQREMLEELQTQIKPVMEELARSRNIDIVLNSDSSVVWGSAQLDMTGAVIERLKAKSAPKSKP